MGANLVSFPCFEHVARRRGWVRFAGSRARRGASWGRVRASGRGSNAGTPRRGSRHGRRSIGHSNRLPSPTDRQHAAITRSGAACRASPERRFALSDRRGIGCALESARQSGRSHGRGPEPDTSERPSREIRLSIRRSATFGMAIRRQRGDAPRFKARGQPVSRTGSCWRIPFRAANGHPMRLGGPSYATLDQG
jgi:hypothetical protein